MCLPVCVCECSLSLLHTPSVQTRGKSHVGKEITSLMSLPVTGWVSGMLYKRDQTTLCVFFCEALEQEQVRSSNRNQTNVACDWCGELTVKWTFWDGGVTCMLWWYHLFSVHLLSDGGSTLWTVCCIPVLVTSCKMEGFSLGLLWAQKHIHVTLVKF